MLCDRHRARQSRTGPLRSKALATPNYSYEKRQRELAKKRKAEEKRNKKTQPQRDDGSPADGDNQDSSSNENGPTLGQPTPPAG